MQAYLALLCFAVLYFSQIEGLRQLCISTIFPTVFAHFISLCHILVILVIFSNFSIIIVFVIVIYNQRSLKFLL